MLFITAHLFDFTWVLVCEVQHMTTGTFIGLMYVHLQNMSVGTPMSHVMVLAGRALEDD